MNCKVLKMTAFICILMLSFSAFSGCKKDDEKDESAKKSTALTGVKTSSKASTTKKTGTSTSTATKSESTSSDNENDNSDDKYEDNQNEYGNDEDDEFAEEPVELDPIDYGGKTIVLAQFGWGLGEPTRESENIDHQKQFASWDDMEQKYNCKIQRIWTQQNEIKDSIINASLSGLKYCDVFYITPQQVLPAFVNQGIIVPIDEYVEQYNYREAFPSLDWEADAGLWAGKRYGIKTKDIYLGGRVVYFNRDIFDREGIPYLYEAFWNGTWDWDMMLDIAIKTTKDLNGDGITDQWGILGLPQFDVLYSNDGSILDFDEAGNPFFSLNTPKNMRAINFLVELSFVHKVVDRTTPANQLNFAAGMHAFYPQGTGQGMGIKGNGGFHNFGVVAFPKGPDATGYSSAVEESSPFFFTSVCEDLRSVTQIFFDYLDVNENEPYYVPIYDLQIQRITATRSEDERYFDEEIKVWFNLLENQKFVFTNYLAPLKGRTTAAVINPAVDMTVPLASAVDSFLQEAQSIIDSYK